MAVSSNAISRTTGGKGGSTVTVTTLAALTSAVTGDTATIVIISGTITGDTVVKIGSNSKRNPSLDLETMRLRRVVQSPFSGSLVQVSGLDHSYHPP